MTDVRIGELVTWCLLPKLVLTVLTCADGDGRVAVREASKPYAVTAWVPTHELTLAPVSYAVIDALIDERITRQLIRQRCERTAKS